MNSSGWIRTIMAVNMKEEELNIYLLWYNEHRLIVVF